MGGKPLEPRGEADLLPQLDFLRAAHRRLIVTYVDAVRRSSFLPGLLEAGARTGDHNDFTFGISGPIARALLAIHIRDRLKLLERVYVQLRRAIREGDDQAYAGWLDDAVAGCREFGQSMSTAQAGLRALQLPGLSLIAIAIIQQTEIPAAWTLIPLLLLAYLLYVAAFKSFPLKRELLLPEAVRLESRSTEEQEAHEGTNAYRREEELASCLGYGRPREGQLDYLVVGLGGLTMVIASVALQEVELLDLLDGTVLGLAGLLSIAFAVSRWRRRRWR